MKSRTFKAVLIIGSVFLSIVLGLFVNSCSLKELPFHFTPSVPSLRIEIPDRSPQRSDNTLFYTLYNNQYDDIYYSGTTILTYLDENEWKEVLDRTQRSYNEKLYTLSLSPLPINGSIDLQMDLLEYGKLRCGIYQIIKPLYDRKGNIILFLASNSFGV